MATKRLYDKMLTAFETNTNSSESNQLVTEYQKKISELENEVDRVKYDCK